MTKKALPITDAIYDYILSVSLRETPAQERLREETAALPDAEMQIAPDQGQFMAMLVRMLGARQAIEVGVYTGYSSLWLAGALPADGRLVACDISEDYTRIARRYWQEAGLADRIDLRLAPAIETLDDLLATEGPGGYDFAFLDAEKTEYRDYYERSLRLLRPGGLIAIDNVLRDGRAADPEARDENTLAVKALNAFLHTDERIDLCLLGIADGLTLCLKR